MQDSRDVEIKQAVREAYAEVAKSNSAGCGCSCSCPTGGYSHEDLKGIPEGANMGLGSGTPLDLADIKESETVLDLGSGGGIDCFLAARQVGERGSVIGVDMTPEMVAKARQNALSGNYGNVDFRLGEIEHLPVIDSSVDVIMSNCVINLTTDKVAAYAEAFRVLKPGGRLAISDVIMTADIPNEARGDLTLHASCVAGATFVDDLKQILSETGFESVEIKSNDGDQIVKRKWAPGSDIADYAVSAKIEAVKPIESSVRQ